MRCQASLDGWMSDTVDRSNYSRSPVYCSLSSLTDHWRSSLPRWATSIGGSGCWRTRFDTSVARSTPIRCSRKTICNCWRGFPSPSRYFPPNGLVRRLERNLKKTTLIKRLSSRNSISAGLFFPPKQSPSMCVCVCNVRRMIELIWLREEKRRMRREKEAERERKKEEKALWFHKRKPLYNEKAYLESPPLPSTLDTHSYTVYKLHTVYILILYSVGCRIRTHVHVVQRPEHKRQKL